MFDKIILALIWYITFYYNISISTNWIPSFNLGSISIGTIDLAFIFACLIASIKFISFKKNDERYPSFLSILMIVFLAIGLIGFINGALSKDVGINLAVREARHFFLFLIYFVILSLEPNKKNVSALVAIIVSFAVINSFFSIIQIGFEEQLFFLRGKIENYQTGTRQAENVIRVGATVGLPVITSGFIYSIILISEKINLKRLLYFSITMMGFILTFARGVWVSTAMSMLVVTTFADRYFRRKHLSYGLVLFVTALFVISISATGIFGNKIRSYIVAVENRLFTMTMNNISKDKSFMGRFKEASMAIKKIKKKPMIGHGLGARAQKVRWKNEQGEVQFLHTGYIHNGYVNITFKLGLIGLVTSVTILIYFSCISLRSLRRIKSDYLKAIYIASLCIVMSIIPLCFILPAIMVGDWIIVIAISMALSQLAYATDSI